MSRLTQDIPLRLLRLIDSECEKRGLSREQLVLKAISFLLEQKEDKEEEKQEEALPPAVEEGDLFFDSTE